MKYSNTDIERIIIAQEEKSPGEMLKFLKNELLESVGSYYLDYKRYKREGESLIVKAEKYLEKNEDMEVNEKLSFGTNLLLSNAPEIIAENFIKFIDIPEASITLVANNDGNYGGWIGNNGGTDDIKPTKKNIGEFAILRAKTSSNGNYKVQVIAIGKWK